MIHIITPCHRVKNLPTIKKSIPKECNWIVVYDKLIEDKKDINGPVILRSGRTGGYGGPNISYAFENYPFEDEDWLVFMDSDNIVHPDWYKEVSKHTHKDFVMITWGQYTHDGQIRLLPVTDPQIGNIDNASFMVKWMHVKDLRRTENYVQDGEYAMEAAQRGPVLALNKYIAYYNYIQ
jgi:hypothetical protein